MQLNIFTNLLNIEVSCNLDNMSEIMFFSPLICVADRRKLYFTLSQNNSLRTYINHFEREVPLLSAYTEAEWSQCTRMWWTVYRCPHLLAAMRTVRISRQLICSPLKEGWSTEKLLNQSFWKEPPPALLQASVDSSNWGGFMSARKGVNPWKKLSNAFDHQIMSCLASESIQVRWLF